MKLPFRNRFLLAPMEGINDIAFRLLCKKAGAGMTYTGMIHPQMQQEIILDDKPCIQLFCTTEKGIKDFIKKHDKRVALWDFNLGCPAKIAKKKGFGVFLHKDLTAIEKILETIRLATKKPVTVKLRKSELAFEVVSIAEKYCDAVCIHPRTQKQGYGGIPDIEFAKKIKSKTFLPVIYSGDIDDKNAKSFLKIFDYVMIGRKAIGNPNIFAKLSDKKFDVTFDNYLPLAKKYNIPFQQIKFQAMNFTKGKSDSRKLRLEIAKCKNLEEIEKLCVVSS